MKKNYIKADYFAPECEISELYSTSDLLEGSITDWMTDPEEI